MDTPDTYSPLLNAAVDETMAEVAARPEWQAEVSSGKMFGVLIARAADGTMHTLRAYSGQICGRSDWPGFVPAVFDYLQPDGYFKRHEAEIDDINSKVTAKENSAELHAAQLSLENTQAEAMEAIDEYKEYIKSQKATRTPAEAQYQNAQLRRLKQLWNGRIAEREQAVNAIRQSIDQLKAERSRMSDALQRWLFEQFKLAGDNGNRSVLKIFTDYASANRLKQTVPPAGTGECCAPKLLHYANAHGLAPLALTEFWYGASPVGEVRHHGMHYGPCQAKCMPLMPWLWPAKYAVQQTSGAQPGQGGAVHLRILYEDEWLVAVDKPAGLLSVPGKRQLPNAEDTLRRDYPFLKVVHRLDMDTSGVLLAAKTPQVFVAMQRQFATHTTVQKEYEALLTGQWPVDRPSRGTISLPLAADFVNRPRQRVDYAEGKEAVTQYELLSTSAPSAFADIPASSALQGAERPIDPPFTRVLLRPLTGRTHQLRVHCAHAAGLAMPILGDPLYGNTPAPRMYLNATRLSFHHPVTGIDMVIESHTPTSPPFTTT